LRYHLCSTFRTQVDFLFHVILSFCRFLSFEEICVDALKEFIFVSLSNFWLKRGEFKHFVAKPKLFSRASIARANFTTSKNFYFDEQKLLPWLFGFS